MTHFQGLGQGSYDLRTRSLWTRRKQHPSVCQVITSSKMYLVIIRFLREWSRLFARVTELARATMQKAGTELAFSEIHAAPCVAQIAGPDNSCRLKSKTSQLSPIFAVDHRMTYKMLGSTAAQPTSFLRKISPWKISICLLLMFTFRILLN